MWIGPYQKPPGRELLTKKNGRVPGTRPCLANELDLALKLLLFARQEAQAHKSATHQSQGGRLRSTRDRNLGFRIIQKQIDGSY